VLKYCISILLFFWVIMGLLSSGQATEATSYNESNNQHNLYLPLVLNRFDSSLGTPVFGVQVYSTNYLAQLTATNSSWVRIPINWRGVEPVKTIPPTYNWSSVDNRVNALTAVDGLNIILTFEGNPAWAAQFGEDGGNGPILASELHRFTAFVQAAVERYDGDGFQDAPGSPVVRYWEFYNEPDSQSLPSDFRWGPYPDRYAQMLIAAYPAVKTANPEAQVVFGGIAYDWFIDQGGAFHREFLDLVLDNGAGPYFDIMNFHAYPAFDYHWAEYGPGIVEKTHFLRQKLAQRGLSKPMMITEAGWHSNAPGGGQFPSTPNVQARYVIALFTQSIAADLETMIWWMLHDPGGNYQFDNGLILNDSQGTPKPAYFVYNHMVEQMRTTHYLRRLSTAETGAVEMEVHLFNDLTHNRYLYVAWLNPVETNSSRLLRLPAAVVTVYDMFGASQVITDGNDGVIDGYVTLAITGQPVYIEVKR
jgi:hypothetical protein